MAGSPTGGGLEFTPRSVCFFSWQTPGRGMSEVVCRGQHKVMGLSGSMASGETGNPHSQEPRLLLQRLRDPENSETGVRRWSLSSEPGTACSMFLSFTSHILKWMGEVQREMQGRTV
jgi:hypothetical protein